MDLSTAVDQTKAALIHYYNSAANQDDWYHKAVSGRFVDNDTVIFERDSPSQTITGDFYGSSD